MMANDMLHESYPGIEVIAEDVSGCTLCRPVREGGIGLDARLAMAIPDIWVELLQASGRKPEGRGLEHARCRRHAVQP